MKSIVLEELVDKLKISDKIKITESDLLDLTREVESPSSALVELNEQFDKVAISVTDSAAAFLAKFYTNEVSQEVIAKYLARQGRYFDLIRIFDIFGMYQYDEKSIMTLYEQSFDKMITPLNDKQIDYIVSELETLRRLPMTGMLNDLMNALLIIDHSSISKGYLQEYNKEKESLFTRVGLTPTISAVNYITSIYHKDEARIAIIAYAKKKAVLSNDNIDLMDLYTVFGRHHYYENRLVEIYEEAMKL